jgi:hypothetical protein
MAQNYIQKSTIFDLFFPNISPKACTIDPIFWAAQIDANTYQQKKNLVQSDLQNGRYR